MKSLRNVLTAVFMASAFPAQAQQDPIRIGLMGPMTGGQADNGEMMRDAARAFEKYINAKAGITGRPLQVVTYDDQCNPEKGVSVANKIASDGINLVVGPFCSGVTKPVRDIFAEHGITNVTPAQVTSITGPEGLFRITPSNSYIGLEASKILEKSQAKKVAIFHSNNEFGTDLSFPAAEYLRAKGIHVLLAQFMAAHDNDFSAITTRARAFGADYVFLAGLDSDISKIARQMRDNAYTGTIVTPGTGTLPQFATVVACPKIDGTLAVAADDKTHEPQNAYVGEALRAAGTEPRDNILFTWTSFDLFKQAIEKAGNTNGADVAKAIRENAFDTPMGRLKFIAEGPMRGNLENPPVALYRWTCPSNIPTLVKQ
jgi:branched-chain amino acid transport system substrate-binding protein